MRTVATLVLGWCLAFPLWSAAPQLAPVPGLGDDKRPRDIRELQIIVAVMGARDPGSQLIALDQWSQEYPATDYEEVRAKLYVKAYFDGRQQERAVEKARDVLRGSPDHFGSAYVLAALSPFAGSSDPALLRDAEAAAHVMLDWEAKRPAANFQQAEAKKAIQYLAHQCLGWSALQSHQAPVAEREFVRSLEADPTAAQVSRWLADAAFAQNNRTKNTLGLFSLARAAYYDGPNSLPVSERQEAAAQLETAYRKRVGDKPEGLQQLIRAARRSAIPPPSFRIP
jgi:hypothetical protein